MTSPPQTELKVDGKRASHPLHLSSSSTGSEKQQQQQQQQQQQLGGEDDDQGVSGCVKPYDSESIAELGVDLPAAAADDDDDDDDNDNDDGVKTCPRCDQQFRCQTRYEKHCTKCCDD